MFEVNLRNQVPMYGTQNPNWGGAACCQMAMNGYPPGATSCFVNQTTIWNYIQAHNKEPGYSPSTWDYGWYADPYAITKALNDLCPPQHHWVDISSADKNAVLYTLLRYMANYQYASLICWWAHDSWAVLVDFITSADPRVVTNPTLEWIGHYWPVSSGAQYHLVDGATWMNALGYWATPCNGVNSAGESLCGNLWNNKWVGIGEPPDEEGVVQVPKISRVGETLIRPLDAAEVAQAFLAERRGAERDNLVRLFSGVRAADPMLVRELPPDPEMRKTEQDVRYYIVPFTNENETDLAGRRLTRLSVLVNAYTGRVEELCVFPQPVRYLSRSDLGQLVGRTLRLSSREMEAFETELVYQPMSPHVSNVQPVWQVLSKDLAFYVTQVGEIVSTLNFPSLRGA